MRTAFIFCGGGPARLPIDVPDDALVIAADVGLAEANRLGVAVDLLVGDLDSVDPVDLEAFEGAGGEVRRHPEDKDATDLELAITDAIVAGAGRLVVVGGDRGRLDHLLANAVLLASPSSRSGRGRRDLRRARACTSCAAGGSSSGRPAS